MSYNWYNVSQGSYRLIAAPICSQGDGPYLPPLRPQQRNGGPQGSNPTSPFVPGAETGFDMYSTAFAVTNSRTTFVMWYSSEELQPGRYTNFTPEIDLALSDRGLPKQVRPPRFVGKNLRSLVATFDSVEQESVDIKLVNFGKKQRDALAYLIHLEYGQKEAQTDTSSLLSGQSTWNTASECPFGPSALSFGASNGSSTRSNAAMIDGRFNSRTRTVADALRLAPNGAPRPVNLDLWRVRPRYRLERPTTPTSKPKEDILCPVPFNFGTAASTTQRKRKAERQCSEDGAQAKKARNESCVA